MDAESNQLGVVPIAKALEIAKQQGYDLAEISPNADPPVCKLLDWGKYLYEQDKRLSKSKKKQRSIEVKQVRMGLKIGLHDIEVKQRAAKKFLEAGNKVKITARFKGREMAKPELGEAVLNKFFANLSDIATIEQKPSMTGRDMSIVISLSKKGNTTKPEVQDNAQDQNK